MNKVVRIKAGTFNDAAAQKLESSGLSVEQAAELGMYTVNSATQLDAQFEAQPSLVIPYFDVDGKPLRPQKAWPEFYRLRYLGEQNGPKGFNDAAGVKPSRYSQPRNTGVCAYFPRCADWKALAADTTEPLLITEGELKAAKATVEGFPTIGLGGVYNFRASHAGVFFLPELEKFNWVRRKVIIVYDSDYAENANVCNAINALADELQERGAIPHVATLENVYEGDDTKTGLDDYLVVKGADALVDLLADAEPLGMSKRLWQMNKEVAYIRDPGMVVALRTAQKMDCSKFAAHSDWAALAVPERKVVKGSVQIIKASAAPMWLKWPMRRAVDKLTYLPGQEQLVEEDGLSYLNQWKGWGVKPEKGNVKPWLELVDFIFKDAPKEEKEWFLDWCAYPIQFPGTKLFSAVIIHGRHTGTGKTLAGYTLARIYGANFIKIKSKDLYDTWWAENRQFVLGDEISGSDKRAEADMMKAMITQEEVNINIKYIPQFSVPDCVNYYLTSNHADALFLEDEDRRFFVHEVLGEPLPLEFYVAYDKWLKKDKGAAALMQWFLDRDLSKFNPKAPALRTQARERMIMVGKSDLAMWLAELKEDPYSKLKVGQMSHQRDLFTSQELLGMYEQEHPHATGKVTKNGMSRALNAAGFKQVYDGQPLTDTKGVQGRYFMVRNADRWRKVSNRKELTKHIALPPVKR